jgi:hypothetical protein
MRVKKLEWPDGSTELLISRLTVATRRALDLICVGLDEEASAVSALKLVGLGLVTKWEEKMPGFPPVTVERYHCALGSAAHRAWCNVCESEVTGGE